MKQFKCIDIFQGKTDTFVCTFCFIKLNIIYKNQYLTGLN